MAGSNIYKVERIAECFGDLIKDIVFVGGAIAELYADTPVPEEIRTTEDVDVVVKIISRIEFNKFEDQLRNLGFKNDTSENAPLCRWEFNGIKVDVMPMDASILGFGNIWYEKGFSKKIEFELSNGINIFILPLMIYMATKLEALKDRGMDDLRISHDFEDIVYLFDNCRNIKDLFDSSGREIKSYLSKEFNKLKKLSVFDEAVLYAMPYGSQNERIDKVLEKINHICEFY